jgi:hypothetical protein
MDKFLRTAHEARENGLDELDRKIRGQEESIKNMAEVIRAQAAAIKQDNDSFKGWMDLVENLEGELQVVKGQVASLSDRVCHCGDVDAAERVPTPALSYESYHSPPVASPHENEIPLAVVMANTILDEDSENVAPPIEVEDGEVVADQMVDGSWTHGEAERILRDIEAAYRQDMVVANQRHQVRSKARVPLARIKPYTGRIALGSRESRRRAREAKDQQRQRRDRFGPLSTGHPIDRPSLEFIQGQYNRSPSPHHRLASRRPSSPIARDPRFTGNSRLGNPSWSLGGGGSSELHLSTRVLDGVVDSGGRADDGGDVAGNGQ